MTLRFGGNVKVVNYANEFAESYARQKDQINDLFQYVIRLAKLAVRNWDYIALGCEYAAGGDIILVPDTSNIAVGAVVSSGQALPLSSNIRVTEIISDTQVRISSTALTSSSVAPAGSAGPGTTYHLESKLAIFLLRLLLVLLFHQMNIRYHQELVLLLQFLLVLIRLRLLSVV